MLHINKHYQDQLREKIKILKGLQSTKISSVAVGYKYDCP